MTPERLKEIAERAEKATGGEWEAQEPWGAAGTYARVKGPKMRLSARIHDGGRTPVFESVADAEFIAHARTDIPDLLRYITRLEKYKQHLPDCESWVVRGFIGDDFMKGKPCTCGLEGGSQ